MATALTVLVMGLTLLQFQTSCNGGGWSKYSFRLNFLSRNGDKLTGHGQSALEDLKQDIVQACRSGELDEVKGYMGRSGEMNIPTKVYYLPHDTGNEITHFLLPAVTCKMDPRTQEDSKTGVNRRTEILLPERKKPLFLPRSQTLTGSQVRTGDWTEFSNRFIVISENAFENDGSPTSSGKQALESLKEDMTEACAAGELKVVRPSTDKDKGGLLDNVRIPTKVYDFTATPKPEEVVLPAIDCQENVLQGETKIGKPQNQYSGVVQESIDDTRLKQTRDFGAIKEKEDNMKFGLNKDDRGESYSRNPGRENVNLDHLNSNPNRESRESREVKSMPTLMKDVDLFGNTKDINSAAESFVQIRKNNLALQSIPEEVVQPVLASQGRPNVFQSDLERRTPQVLGDTVVHESVDDTGLKKAEDFGTIGKKEDVTKLSSNFKREYSSSLSREYGSSPSRESGSSLSRDFGSESRRLDHVGSNLRSNSWGDRESKSNFDSTPTQIAVDQPQPFNVDAAASNFIERFRSQLQKTSEQQRQMQGPAE